MAGFSNVAALRTAIDAGQTVHAEFYKDGPTGEGAGFWTSVWTSAGLPSAGATPATTPGTSYSATAGGLLAPNTTPQRKFLAGIRGSCTTNCTLMLYDRLVAVSGISLTSLGDVTISSAALPRYTDATPWLEITTNTVNTAGLSLNSYTNQSGTTGRAGPITSLTNISANTLWAMPLQTGDSGVQAISTVNINTNATAGVANVVLLRPIAYLPLFATSVNGREFFFDLTAMPRIYDGATLGLAYLATSTVSHDIYGSIDIVYG